MKQKREKKQNNGEIVFFVCKSLITSFYKLMPGKT